MIKAFVNWLTKISTFTPPEIKPYTPVWYLIAQKEIGTREISGGENKRILEYHSATLLKATDDETPWCSSFVSWCLQKSGVVSTKSARARSYLEWGVELTNPILGCVVVFSRGHAGHVGFYVSESTHTIKVLGGNQNNQVCLKDYPKENLLGFRWPS